MQAGPLVVQFVVHTVAGRAPKHPGGKTLAFLAHESTGKGYDTCCSRKHGASAGKEAGSGACGHRYCQTAAKQLLARCQKVVHPMC